MKPDLKKLTELADFVEEYVPKDKLDMQHFAFGSESFSLDPECTTTACLAGIATLLWPNELVLESTRFGVSNIVHTPSGDDDYEGLSSMFGLSRDQVGQVFGTSIPNDEAVSNLRKRIKEWAKGTEK